MSKRMNMETDLRFRCTKKLLAEAAEFGERKGMAVSTVARMALIEFLERQAKPLEAKRA